MLAFKPPGDKMAARQAVEENVIHANPRSHRESVMPPDQHVDPDVVAGNVFGNVVARKESDATDGRASATKKFIDDQRDPNGFHPGRLFAQERRQRFLHGLPQLQPVAGQTVRRTGQVIIKPFQGIGAERSRPGFPGAGVVDDNSPGTPVGIVANILRGEIEPIGQLENPPPADDIDNILVLKTDPPLQFLRRSAQFAKKPFPAHLREVQHQHPGVDVQFVQLEPDLRLVVKQFNSPVAHSGTQKSAEVRIPQLRKTPPDHQVGVEVEGLVELRKEFRNGIPIIGVPRDVGDVEFQFPENGVVDDTDIQPAIRMAFGHRVEPAPAAFRQSVGQYATVERQFRVVFQYGNQHHTAVLRIAFADSDEKIYSLQRMHVIKMVRTCARRARGIYCISEFRSHKEARCPYGSCRRSSRPSRSRRNSRPGGPCAYPRRP